MSAVPPVGRKAAKFAVRPRFVFTIFLVSLCLFAVAQKIDGIDISEVRSTVFSVTEAQWAAALVFTALSFFVVGQYDALFHRFLKTGVPGRAAVLSGAAAIALSQTLGLGLATGTLARWRSLTCLSLPHALKLTNYVSFSFMIALGLVTALAVLVSPLADQGAALFALSAGLVTVTAFVVSLLQPRWLPVPLPSWRLMLRLAGLATLDVSLAALAFWILLPNAVVVDPAVLFAAFVVALGAGLLSGAPGGVGPFELCLITLLPTVPEPELIATILCFRLVYYALPACLAVVVLARPLSPFIRTEDPCLHEVATAESMGLTHQPGHDIAYVAGQPLHLAEASQTVVCIGDSVNDNSLEPGAFKALTNIAKQRQRWAACYKIGVRSAAVARQHGWAVLAVSEEALLCPKSFTLDIPARRQLRRKLRQADKAGVTAVTATGCLPDVKMAEVAADWSARMGGERGFSMGRFSTEHVARQRCVLAYRDGELIAFASFHISENEWVLDLMRSVSDAPDGTMHALIVEALATARAEGISSLSLAAMPREARPAWTKRVRALRDLSGLRRFKMSFAPTTKPLFIAAPNHAVLCLAALDIALRISRPQAMRASRFEPQTPGARETGAHAPDLCCDPQLLSRRL